MSSIAINRRTPVERPWISLLLTEGSIRALTIFAALITITYMVAQPAGDAGKLLSNGIFTLVSGGAAWLCLRTARLLGDDGLPWRCFGLGCGVWFLGQLAWNWYDIVLWTPPPYPSLADVGYGIFYPFMFAGLALLIRQRIGELPAGEVLLDSLIIVTSIALLAYEVMVSPMAGVEAVASPALLAILALDVSTFALVLLTAAALFVRTRLMMRGPLGVLLIGFVAFTASNTLYSRLALDGAYAIGKPIDLGWILGFTCFGIAALVAAHVGDGDRGSIDRGMHRRAAIARMLLMVFSIIVVTAIAAYAAAHPGSDTAVVVLVLISGGLLAIRLGYAALQSEYLSRRTRERDLMAGVVFASQVISSTLDLDNLLPLLASAAADSVGRAHAEVYVFTDDLSAVEASAISGFSAAEAARLQSLNEAPVGAYPAERRAIETLAPVPQWSDDPGIPADDARMFHEIGKLHTLVTPLVAHDRVLGVFDMWTPFDATPFEPADVAAAAAVGQQAGLAIHNARLLARTQQHATEQAALLRVSQAAISSLDLDAVLAEIAQASLGVANAEACAIEIWRPELDDSILAAEATIDDWPGTSAVGSHISFDDWPISRRVLGEQVTLNLLATDADLSDSERNHLLADDTHCVLLAPLVVNSASLGILNLFSRNARRFTTDEVRLASDLAAQIALAIERARLHEALRERADTDGLTGVLNHRAILETLDAEIARTRRGGPPLSILMIDLDGFKQVNDTRGHQSGDQVLRETAAFLRSSVREIDQVGRYGGDEFLLILPQTDATGARQAASRLLDLADDSSVTIDGVDFPIQLSAGIATTADDGATRQELLAAADTRMYEAKAARRWTVAGSGG